MPMYEFFCETCEQTYEELFLAPTGDDDITYVCPKCGRTCSKLFSQGHFHLKGVGWSDDARKQRQRWYDDK